MITLKPGETKLLSLKWLDDNDYVTEAPPLEGNVAWRFEPSGQSGPVAITASYDPSAPAGMPANSCLVRHNGILGTARVIAAGRMQSPRPVPVADFAWVEVTTVAGRATHAEMVVSDYVEP